MFGLLGQRPCRQVEEGWRIFDPLLQSCRLSTGRFLAQQPSLQTCLRGLFLQPSLRPLELSYVVHIPHLSYDVFCVCFQGLSYLVCANRIQVWSRQAPAIHFPMPGISEAGCPMVPKHLLALNSLNSSTEYAP